VVEEQQTSDAISEHSALQRGAEEGSPGAELAEPTTTLTAQFDTMVAATIRAEAMDNGAAPEGSRLDVWEDTNVMHLLKEHKLPPHVAEAEVRRARKRAAMYSWREGVLRRRFAGGSEKVVPPPGEARVSAIKQMHERCGHFGVKRTMHLALLGHWWQGMLQQVRDVVRRCEACERVKASFSARTPQLQPLPIEGMFYRWGVDLCGPFDISRQGNRYAMVCVEYFSKHVEAIALPNKTSDATARAFLSHVLARFGACAEVVTDGGREFQGEFSTLLSECYIDHRVTSPNDPQADGLAERCVQTVKKALTKLATATQTQTRWDEHLPWVLLGYRCSKQASTGLSPYEMLYARPPTMPVLVRERLKEPLAQEADQLDAMAMQVVERAALIKRMCVMAGDNLRIAQHRDTLSYAKTRGGGFMPRLRKFEAGDFVYVRRTGNPAPLEPEAKQLILQVVEVRPSGVLVLRGNCGSHVKANMKDCAPCHNPSIDPTIDQRSRSPMLHCRVRCAASQMRRIRCYCVMGVGQVITCIA
jgi:hypothetical protein